MANKASSSKRKPTASRSPVVRSTKSARFSFGSHKLKILAVVFVLVVGGFGTWKVMDSRATTALTKLQCNLLGRPYGTSTGTCYRSCQSGAGYYITSQYWGYCSEALSTGVGTTKCAELNRTYLFYGCTRRWIRTAATGVGQCRYSTYTYVPVSSGYDYCKAPAGTTTTTTTTTTGWAWPVPGESGIGTLGYGEWTSSGYHKGIDIGNYYGSTYGKKVVAAKGGYVTQAYYSSSCGYMIVIRADGAKLSDGTQLYTAYQHLATKNVSAGQTVATGVQIGTVGKFGETTCGGSSTNAFYHLHFSVEKGNWISWYGSSLSNTVNPCGYYSQC